MRALKVKKSWHKLFLALPKRPNKLLKFLLRLVTVVRMQQSNVKGFLIKKLTYELQLKLERPDASQKLFCYLFNMLLRKIIVCDYNFVQTF